MLSYEVLCSGTEVPHTAPSVRISSPSQIWFLSSSCPGIPSRRPLGGKTAVDKEKEDFLFGTDLEIRKSFQDLGMSESLVYALRANQKMYPTQIQGAAYPVIVEGKDVVIGAETGECSLVFISFLHCVIGSGKTLAYLLPVFQRMLNGLVPRQSPKYPATYVLVPSKELCQQVF